MQIVEFISQVENEYVQTLLFAADDYLVSLLPEGGKNMIKYKIPFYVGHKNIFFTNPHKNYITIGFPYGFKMTNERGNLLGEKEKLKQARYIRIYTLEDLYSEEIAELLTEAIALDASFKK